MAKNLKKITPRTSAPKENYIIFFLKDGQILDSTSVTAQIIIALKEEKELLKLLKDSSRKTKAKEILFDEKYLPLRASESKIILSFSSNKFAQKAKNFKPTEENKKAFNTLRELGEKTKDFPAVIYLPN